MADKPKHSNPEPTFRDSELKALRAFVGGYLHQDFVAEHKTPAAALDAYCREVDRATILKLESDLERFMAKTSDLAFDAAREIFVREFHSGWSPPNRAAIAHLVRMAHAQLQNR